MRFPDCVNTIRSVIWREKTPGYKTAKTFSQILESFGDKYEAYGHFRSLSTGNSSKTAKERLIFDIISGGHVSWILESPWLEQEKWQR